MEKMCYVRVRVPDSRCAMASAYLKRIMGKECYSFFSTGSTGVYEAAMTNEELEGMMDYMVVTGIDFAVHKYYRDSFLAIREWRSDDGHEETEGDGDGSQGD